MMLIRCLDIGFKRDSERELSGSCSFKQEQILFHHGTKFRACWYDVWPLSSNVICVIVP